MLLLGPRWGFRANSSLIGLCIDGELRGGLVQAKRLERAYYDIWKTEPQESLSIPEGKGKGSTSATAAAPELKIGDCTESFA